MPTPTDDAPDATPELSEADRKIIVQALKDLGLCITGLEGLSPDTEEDGDLEDAKNKLEDCQELLQGAINGEEEA